MSGRKYVYSNDQYNIAIKRIAKFEAEINELYKQDVAGTGQNEEWFIRLHGVRALLQYYKNECRRYREVHGLSYSMDNFITCIDIEPTAMGEYEDVSDLYSEYDLPTYPDEHRWIYGDDSEAL